MTGAKVRTQDSVPTVLVAGVPVSRLGLARSADLVTAWLRESDGSPRRVSTANLDFLRLAARDPDLHRILTESDLVTADGAPVVWLSRRLGMPVAERVPGVDLVSEVLARSAADACRVYFLGGQPGDGIAAAETVEKRWPGIRVVGTACPVVDVEDHVACRALAEGIRESGAELLLVALGCPKQERFLDRYLEATGCRVGLGVGGTLAFLSGRIRRAPVLVQKSGLEWAWRCGREPRRLLRRYVHDFLFLISVRNGGVDPGSRRRQEPIGLRQNV